MSYVEIIISVIISLFSYISHLLSRTSFAIFFKVVLYRITGGSYVCLFSHFSPPLSRLLSKDILFLLTFFLLFVYFLRVRETECE